ncbi:MAG: hypothetical protein RLY86_2452 [Pseudomonadota bacterium]|jgi:hypothetical protein
MDMRDQLDATQRTDRMNRAVRMILGTLLLVGSGFALGTLLARLTATLS